MQCQRHLFTLDVDNGFLNGAYMSPQLKSVQASGAHALLEKNDPTKVTPEHFFTAVEELRKSYARLIDCDDYQRIALVPAVSYGVAIVAKNLPLVAGQNIVIAAGQFPSNYYSWAEKCAETGAELRIVDRPTVLGDATEAWNEAMLAAIDENTALLALSHIHWADGTLWDLAALRQRTRDVGAWLLVDGTQSVGALPFSVQAIQPDALICAGYKWLMGPYSTGYAYFGPALDNGKPIEENWINRHDSHNFKNLVHYQSAYRPKAGRYCVGQQSNFMLVPMQQSAIDQLNAWGTPAVQAYCKKLWQPILADLAELGIELNQKRAHHLVGIRLPGHLNAEQLPAELARRKLTVSFRGDAIRVAPNVYNREDELVRMLEALQAIR